jgi:predicted transposase YdaD
MDEQTDKVGVWLVSKTDSSKSGRQAGRQAGWQAGRQAGRLAGRQTGRQAGRQMEDSQVTDRQINHKTKSPQ